MSNKIVGLSYQPGNDLPDIVVKGHGEAAERILAYRRKMGGPPIIKDNKLGHCGFVELSSSKRYAFYQEGIRGELFVFDT